MSAKKGEKEIYNNHHQTNAVTQNPLEATTAEQYSTQSFHTYSHQNPTIGWLY